MKRWCKCGHPARHHRGKDTECSGRLVDSTNAVGVRQYISCHCLSYRAADTNLWLEQLIWGHINRDFGKW